MSIRPSDNGSPPTPPALVRWPKPPADLKTKADREAWERLGAALMVLGSASSADLLLAARAARVMARVDELFTEDDLKASTLASMLRIEVELLKQLGLSPQARRQVAPLPKEKTKSGFEDVE